MKKIFALVICALFVLSTASFALWGIGERKSTETKVITSETKGKAVGKVMGKGKKLGIIKKETKGKKGEMKIKKEKKEKKAKKEKKSAPIK